MKLRFLVIPLTLTLTQVKADITAINPGESLRYIASFKGLITTNLWLDIALITLQVGKEAVIFNGEPGYQLKMTLSTQDFKKAELIYSIRYQINSIVSRDFKRTLFFEDKADAHKIKHKVIWLDWTNKTATLYRNRKKTIIEKGLFNSKSVWQKLEQSTLPAYLSSHYPEVAPGIPYLYPSDPPVTLSGITHDKLSSLFYARTLEMATGDSSEFNLCNGKQITKNRIINQGKEQIKLNHKIYDTIKINVDTKNLEGVFQKSSDPMLNIWITDDNAKIPVQIISKVKYGYFRIALKSE